MAEVKWIKLATDIFDNRKIRQIECLPEGDAIIVLWLKILCLAGNINDNGYIYFTKDIPYTDQMLSAQFNTPIHTVQLALKTFEEFGMLDIVDDILIVSNWEKYQNIDGMERIREQNRIRAVKFRERHKELACNVTHNVTVTHSNATDIDKKEEIRIREESIGYKEVVDLYHSLCPSFPEIRAVSESRQKAIKARLKTYTIDDFRLLFTKAEESDFLKGKNNRNWSATFDWLIKDSNMAKVIEGNYDNKSSGTVTKQNTTAQQLNEFYDMAAGWAEGDGNG